MNKKNLEDNLKSIRLRQVSPSEKDSLWVNIVRVNREGGYKKSLAILSIFNFKKHMIGALIALLILGGGGGVVAASNAAVPGDTLYGIDLAVEKAKVNFASSVEKKDELRIKFADERVAEVRSKSEVKGSANTADIDLSAATITEIEADVFTNETTVKIEADDRHYGFVTVKKTRADVVAEIAAKYSLTVAEIDAMIDFETEDRASRADDKGFLNSSNSVEIKSEKEKRDLEMSLRSLSDMDGLSTESQARLNAAINEIRLILEANPNSKIKIENGDFKIEVKENGMVKFESEDDDRDEDDKDEDEDSDDEDDNKGHGNDDDREDDDNPGNSTGVNINAGAGANANVGGNSDDDDSDSDDDSDDDDDDNSGSGNDDDDDDNDNDDDNDEDEDSDSDDDDDNDNDDDNSGSGSNDDDEDEEDED
jgi:ribosomal protein L23